MRSLLFLAAVFVTVSANCRLDLRSDLTQNHPLLLSSNSAKWISLENSPNDGLTFNKDEIVRLACPSKSDDNKNSFAKFKPQEVLIAKCKSGTNFEVNQKSYPFGDLQCEKPVQPSELKTGKECSGQDTELIKIGYNVNSDFVTEYDVCYNKKQKLPVYTEVTVPETIKRVQNEPKEFTWVSNAEEPATNLDKFYSCATQSETFKRILNKNFFENSRCCLEKGRMVSSKHMLFIPEKVSTAHYLNTVPQWSTCNTENWKLIENKIVDLADRNHEPLTVFTGTYRNMALPAKWGFSHKDMYLQYSSSSDKSLPVPLYIWKVVYSPRSRKAVAIIQINNPHMTRVEVDSFTLCEDVCKNVNWLNFLNRQTIVDGYIYCCELNDFEHGFHFKKSPFPKATGGLLREGPN